jgi:acyl carrier protein
MAIEEAPEIEIPDEAAEKMERVKDAIQYPLTI